MKLFLVILFVVICFGPVFNQTENKPNIIFIFADDWGWGDLSIHNSSIARTPNLDRLAREGTEFYQFTVASPVCSPSRVAIMTGNFPNRYSISRHFASSEFHEMNNMPDWLDPDLPHLPKVLQKNGYKTGHFGKWHLTNVHIKDAPMPTAYGYDKAMVFNGPGDQIKTSDVCREASKFIRENKDHPFFLNVWIHETHTPHYPKKKYMDQFIHLEYSERVYAAVVAEADAEIGRLIKTVDELDLRDNSIIIFSSDNGPESSVETNARMKDASTGPGLGRKYSVGSAGPYIGRKRSLYEGGIRVPFIISWPGNIPENRIDSTSVITSVDLYPTLLALAGIEIPNGHNIDGENISQALWNQSFERKRPIFWKWSGSESGYNWPRIAIRDGNWKLLASSDGIRVELYNMEKFPTEGENQSKREKAIVTKLLGKIDRWKKSLPESPDPKCFSSNR